MRMTKSSEIWNRAERPPSVPSIEPIAPGSYGVQISIRIILQTKILRQHNSTHMICVLYKIWYLRYRKTNMRQRRGHACRRAREAPRTSASFSRSHTHERSHSGGKCSWQSLASRSGRYYSGTTTRVNRDGTYDIKFDDGERKSSVKKSQIKSKTSRKSSPN